MQTQQYTFEIIIADDGSEDQGMTKEIAQNFNCIYTYTKKNFGKGSSIRQGMQIAQGKYRIFTDADIPYDLRAIEKIMHHLSVQEYDLVIGDRTLPDSKYYTEISKLRKTASKIYSFVVGRFIAGGMFDTQCGIKGFNEKSATNIFGLTRINGFACDVEILYIALKKNYDIKKIPVQLRSQDGKTVHIAKHTPGMLIDLFKIISNFYRKKYKEKNV